MKVSGNKEKIVNAIGLPEHIADWLTDFSMKYSIWFAKQLQDKKDITIESLEEQRQDFQSVVDWVVGSPLRGQHVTLKRYDLETAIKKSKLWHEEIERESVGEITIDDKDGKVLLQFSDGYYWVDLETSQSSSEARAMQHCGAACHGNTLVSLRRDGKPYVTADMNKSYTEYRQMKGRQNKKPLSKYHKYIVALLDKFEVTSANVYDSDFSIGDLPVEQFPLLATKKHFKILITDHAVDKAWNFDKISKIIPNLVKEEYHASCLRNSPGIKRATYKNGKFDIVANSWPSHSGYCSLDLEFLSDFNIGNFTYVPDSSYHRDTKTLNFDIKCDTLIYDGDIIIEDRKYIKPREIYCKSLEFNGVANAGEIEEVFGNVEIVNITKFNGNNLTVNGEVLYHDVDKIVNVKCDNEFKWGVDIAAAFRKRNISSSDIHIDDGTIIAEHIELSQGMLQYITTPDGKLKYQIKTSQVTISGDFNEFEKITAEEIIISNEYSHKLIIDCSYMKAKNLYISTDIKDNGTLVDAQVRNLWVDRAHVDRVPKKAVKITAQYGGSSIGDAKGSTAKYWIFNNYGSAALPKNMPDSVLSLTINGCWADGNLKTLKGCPQNIKRNFKCTDGSLKNLEGMPKYVGKNVNVNKALADDKFTTVEDVKSRCKVGGKIVADKLNDDKLKIKPSAKQIKKLTDIGLIHNSNERIIKNGTYRFEDHTLRKFYTINAKTGNAYWRWLDESNDHNKTILHKIYDFDIQIESIIEVVEKHRENRKRQTA